MAVEVPKFRENQSSFELEEMIDPIKERVSGTFYTRRKTDYSPLIEAMRKGKVKK